MAVELTADGILGESGLGGRALPHRAVGNNRSLLADVPDGIFLDSTGGPGEP